MTGKLPAIDQAGVWLAERFTSVQGEGPSLGRPAVFVRLSGCHLSCVWCDTAYTWDESRFDLTEQREAVRVEALAEWVDQQPATLLIVTGGEPLLQQDKVILLLQILDRSPRRIRVEVETSGTIAPRPELVELVTTFNVSPKLAHSGIPASSRLRPRVLKALARTQKVEWKFVVRDLADLDEVDDLLGQAGIDVTTAGNVWIMPEGTEPATILKGLHDLAEPVLARGWNLAPRLHILLWGDERAR